MDISYIILDNLPWFWFGLAVLMAVIEGFTLGLTTIWFAIGALITIFISFTGIPFSWQILIFLVISSGLLFFTRPLAIKKLKPGRVKTNADSNIGKTGIVVKTITKFDKGEVKADGKIWAARTEHDTPLEKGSECIILRIEGVTLIVAPTVSVTENSPE